MKAKIKSFNEVKLLGHPFCAISVITDENSEYNVILLCGDQEYKVEAKSLILAINNATNAF
jgi:hypothetical protein